MYKASSGVAIGKTDAGEFFLVFVISMLTSVFGLTTLAAGNLHIAETIVGLLGRAFAGLRAILRPPLAYLARRSVRTGLTTGVFAVVIGILSLFAVFYVIFQPDYEEFGNGYDVRVLSTGSARVDMPPEVRSEVERTLVVPTRGYIGSLRLCGKATKSDPCPRGEGGFGGDAERITFEGAYNVTPRPSPDGKSMAYITSSGGTFQLAVMDLASRQTQILTDSDKDESPTYSPNGRMILFATEIGGRGVLGSIRKAP